MSQSIYFSIATLISASICCLLAVPAHAVPAAPFEFGSASLFKTTRKNFDEHRFITGPIEYRVDEEHDREGYFPLQTLTSAGAYREKIYDHLISNTALEIANTVSRQLTESGYALDYQCEKKQCGDVQAWQLYLSPYVDGDAASQYYFFAQKTLNDSTVHQVAVYINEFSGVPRTVIQEVSAQAPGPLLAVEQPSELAALEQLSFAFDSAKLDQTSKRTLRKLVEDLRGTSDAVLIVGHADERGSNKYNDILSTARAVAVQEFLIRAGLERSRVFLRGDGERSAVTGHTASAKRRVDIFKVATRP